MAPEIADVLVLDLRLDDAGELVGTVHIIERAAGSQGKKLYVTWNAEGVPKDFFPVAGGIISVANTPKTLTHSYDVKPDGIGKDRYGWRYNTQTDLMIVLAFPEGYVPDDCKPYPIRAKTFKGRVVAFWRFGEGSADIQWTMRQSRTDLANEVRQINKKAVRKPNPTLGDVRIVDPGAPRWELIAIFAFGVMFIIALLVLAMAFPEPTPFQYTVFRIVIALAAAGVAALIPGFIEVKYKGFIQAGGALAVFVVVYFFSPAKLVENAPSDASVGASPTHQPVKR